MHLCSPGAGHQSLTQQSLSNQCLCVEQRHTPELAGPQGGRQGFSGAFTSAIISAAAVFALHSLSHLYQLGGNKKVVSLQFMVEAVEANESTRRKLEAKKRLDFLHVSIQADNIQISFYIQIISIYLNPCVQFQQGCF